MNTIERTIDIAASPASVWATLVDFPAYPEWNPFVTAVDGDAVVGEQLSVRVEPPEGRAMTFSPTVTTAVPNEHLEWVGRLLVRGLFDGRHEFRLEPTAEDHTRFVHREHFSGLLVGLLLDEGDIGAGFEAMNEALKTRVEDRMERTGSGDRAVVA
ncbi:SRPBCC domain-containing protein [Halapricum sp. CBA1109]|uniref:SRPBCC domain-containing protein n=1 Tax=Halapricum sp. CBA1109 TaxID=2668068 RepID=UPI0012F8C28F|nr:SRPBCC domain-containing protein [Halapricum sp. CBA1109]MUV89593.1 SRPBCC domain-containing protein [Halapricum sp. CBA1109]